MLDRNQWTREIDRLLAHPPVAGDFLRTADGSAVRVDIDLPPGSEPFIFARIYLRQTVGVDPGWFARSMDDHDTSGWRCILMPRARKELIRRFGLSNTVIGVKQLRVVKGSESNRSLQVEVSDW